MEILKPENYGEFEKFNRTHKNGNFMQSLLWARVKNNWKTEIVVSRDAASQIVGGVLILIQKIPVLPTSLLYAPRGMVCNLEDKVVVSDLLEGIKLVAKKYKAYMFKMDPYVMASDKKNIQMIKNLGFDFTENAPDFSTFQTRNNYMLNIENKKSDEVLANFHSKWRYNIRVAAKHGVECKICDKSHIDEFYRLMKITGDRDGFITRPKDYFIRMLDAFGEDVRLYLCYYQGKAISGAITTVYAGKTCYVYGASDNEFRFVMPNHLMQWNMIQWAIERNCYIYDFQGILLDINDENNPRYGVYRFKKGFNGEVVEFAGEFDYVFSKLMMKMVDQGERAVKFVRKIQRKLTTTGKK